MPFVGKICNAFKKPKKSWKEGDENKATLIKYITIQLHVFGG
jgi:hypothetical protein